MYRERTHTEAVERASDYAMELWNVMAYIQESQPDVLSHNYAVVLSACELGLSRSGRLPHYYRLGATLLDNIDPSILPLELRRLACSRPLQTEALPVIAELAGRLSSIFRLPQYPHGVAEDDLSHSVNLALYVAGVSEAIAPRDQAPHRLGRAILLALVHDMPELISGDEVTLGLNAEQMATKKRKDELALRQLMNEYGGLVILHRYLLLYERQDTRDAKIVYVADKSLPAVSHAGNNGRVILALGERYDSPNKYLGGAISETSRKIAHPRYSALPFWQSVYDEGRARAGVATYGINIHDARKQSTEKSRESGLVVPDEWVVV